jgi:hypothetical protein
MNSTSLADRLASLLPNTTAAATADSPQACLHSCLDACGVVNGHHGHIYWLCCASGCWSQGCAC